MDPAKGTSTSDTSLGSSAADDTGSLRHCAASRSQDDSGEIAADRILHVQRFTLPPGLNTAAQPRLGRRPPGTVRGHRQVLGMGAL
jgi:hypothetical protein